MPADVPVDPPSDDELFQPTAGDAEVTDATGGHPEFAPEKLHAAFPDMVRFDVSQRPADGVIVCDLVGKDGGIEEVELGETLPANSEAMIEAIKAYQAIEIDVDLLDASADAFDFDV